MESVVIEMLPTVRRRSGIDLIQKGSEEKEVY
jgi:hypothetical protein